MSMWAMCDMILNFHDKIEEISTIMEKEHAKQIIDLVAMKASYDRKVEHSGKETVDMIIKISKRQRANKIQMRKTKLRR